MDEAPGLFDAAPVTGITPAPFLPTSRAEMERLGWAACDILLVTGDAYVDHPSFGAALIGRLLEAHGFRVGILAQPDWRSAAPFAALGTPRLFVGITAGNMDSMVNRYTAHNKPRSDDAYTPGDVAGRRPDRAAIVYAQRAREAFGRVPILLGGIEASLRRLAHYDVWSDAVRRSILLDAKADLLLYGNAERAVVAIAHALARGEPTAALGRCRGVVSTGPAIDEAELRAVRLPAFEEVSISAPAFARAARVAHAETNPFNARALVQRHGDRDVRQSPPPWPLATAELDRLYELPFARRPHPSYGDARIRAWEMIRFSVTIQRGCFGGCTFCSITEHEGRIIQSRSRESVVREVLRLRDGEPDFRGTLSDLGGPTANMYRMGCASPALQRACRRPSCIDPAICRHLDHDHRPLIELYRQVRAIPGVERVLIASGVRHDLALVSPAYLEELITHHVGGHLKVAPEHAAPGTLRLMRKPGIAAFEAFLAAFARLSRAAGKEQYVIPYWIAAHPGTTLVEMLELAVWLKAHGLSTDQVQTFLPTPMTLATAMYHTGLDPTRRVDEAGGTVVVTRDARTRRVHKAFLRYHDPSEWPLLRRVLRELGRGDLIGSGPGALVPAGAGQPRPRRPSRWGR